MSKTVVVSNKIFLPKEGCTSNGIFKAKANTSLRDRRGEQAEEERRAEQFWRSLTGPQRQALMQAQQPQPKPLAPIQPGHMSVQRMQQTFDHQRKQISTALENLAQNMMERNCFRIFVWHWYSLLRAQPFGALGCRRRWIFRNTQSTISKLGSTKRRRTTFGNSSFCHVTGKRRRSTSRTPESTLKWGWYGRSTSESGKFWRSGTETQTPTQRFWQSNKFQEGTWRVKREVRICGSDFFYKFFSYKTQCTTIFMFGPL